MNQPAKYEIHEAANAFPMVDKAELNELAEDIKARGLLVPITLFDGKILDGRNRYAACEIAGIEPNFDSIVVDDPFMWVWSLNGERRHLASQEQKALIWRRLHGMSETMQAKRQQIKNEADGARSVAQKGKPNDVAQSVLPRSGENKTRKAEAMAAGVNMGAMQRATTLEKQAPELAEKVARGEIRFGQAQGEIKKRKLHAEVKKSITTSATMPHIDVADCMEWLPGEDSCDLLITDPPYMTDVDNIEDFAAQWLPLALSKVKDTGRAYIFVGAYPEELAAYMAVAMPTQILVWTYRNTLGPSPKRQYKMNWQAILYYEMTNAHSLNCPVMVEQFAVQNINAPDGRLGDRYHSWQKPIELAERLVRHSTKEGDLVLDPFACTGTFLIAAARLGRFARGCEIDPENAAIAHKRGVS